MEAQEGQIWSWLVCGGPRDTEAWRGKVVKAEELCNTTRIHTELFGLPTHCQAGLGHEGLREWVEGG